MCPIHMVGKWVPLHNNPWVSLQHGSWLPLEHCYPPDQGRSYDAFDDLTSDVTHSHFHNTLLDTHMNPDSWERTTQWMDSRRWASPWRLAARVSNFLNELCGKMEYAIRGVDSGARLPSQILVHTHIMVSSNIKMYIILSKYLTNMCHPLHLLVRMKIVTSSQKYGEHSMSWYMRAYHLVHNKCYISLSYYYFLILKS